MHFAIDVDIIGWISVPIRFNVQLERIGTSYWAVMLKVVRDSHLIDVAIVSDLEPYVNNIVHSRKVLLKVGIASIMRNDVRFQQDAH